MGYHSPFLISSLSPGGETGLAERRPVACIRKENDGRESQAWPNLRPPEARGEGRGGPRCIPSLEQGHALTIYIPPIQFKALLKQSQATTAAQRAAVAAKQAELDRAREAEIRAEREREVAERERRRKEAEARLKREQEQREVEERLKRERERKRLERLARVSRCRCRCRRPLEGERGVM